MSRPSDPKKLAVWRARLERLPRSGLTVARFCARERVSVASFYHWRRKLGQAALRRGVPARRGIFRQVTVVPATPGVAPPPAAPGVSIQLPCGTRIEVHAEHLDAVRAVVGEVARVGRGLEADVGRDLQVGAIPC